MKLSEIVDAHNLNVVGTYSNRQWTFVCQDIVRPNGSPISSTSGHPIDALKGLAQAASGRHLTIVPKNLALPPISYEGW